MYDITAYLTIKNKTFYTVLTYYVDGIRKMKWVSTGFKEMYLSSEKWTTL